MPDPSLVVDMRDIRFTYPGSHKPALELDSFQVAARERVFLRGPSGMGKTTLLGLVAGIHLPNSGHVHVLGRDLVDMSHSSRDSFRGRHIGYIFQLFNLIPYLNVWDNVLIQVDLSVGRSSEHEKRAQHLLEHLGLESAIRKPVTELSVGQQQRVAAARALVGQPELVIADEPTSALDYDLRDAFLEKLFQLCAEQGSALLFVSHDPSLQTHFDRVVDLGTLNRSVSQVREVRA